MVCYFAWWRSISRWFCLSQLLLWLVTLFRLPHCSCQVELLWRLWESSDVCLAGSDFISDLGACSYCWFLCHIAPWLPSEHSITLPLSVPDPWCYRLAYAWVVWTFRIAYHCVHICCDGLAGFLCSLSWQWTFLFCSHILLWFMPLFLG